MPAPLTVFLAVHLPVRQRYGFTRFRLGFCLFTGGLCAHVLPVREVATGPRTFWFRPVSIFGLLPITVFINSSHVLTLLTSLALLPHDACSKVKPLTGLYPG